MEAERYPRRIEIRRETYGSEAARALTDPLATELLERHGRPGSGSEPPASDFDPPEGAFLVGSVDVPTSRAAASAASTARRLRSGGCT
jgi:hypothetical protein